MMSDGKSTRRKPGFNTEKGVKGFVPATPVKPIVPTFNNSPLSKDFLNDLESAEKTPVLDAHNKFVSIKLDISESEITKSTLSLSDITKIWQTHLERANYAVSPFKYAGETDKDIYDIYAIDIETDTSPLTQEEKNQGYLSRGLDPAISRIINIAIASSKGTVVFDGEERDILNKLEQYFRTASPGIVVTWNGSVFDFPFINDRARILKIPLGLLITENPQIVPKYTATPGHRGGYGAEWTRENGSKLGHIDIAYSFKNFAEENDITWSLKPMATAKGLNPVKVDASAIHLLTKEQVNEYVASDALVTRTLAFY